MVWKGNAISVFGEGEIERGPGHSYCAGRHLEVCSSIFPWAPVIMYPAVKRRKFTPTIAQASADAILANSRVEVLQNAGYKVRTFRSPDKLAIACKNESFDLLLVGHLLEDVEREQMCAVFRTYNPGAPILQLQAVRAVPCAADYELDVENGPEALVQLLEEIFGGWGRATKVGD
jgi:hypothetical protein